jgi:hypothetical protein
MAFDLSTPAAQLAFDVARRAQEVQDLKAQYEAQARERVNARLAPYGNDLSQFDSTFKSIYDPVAATQQSRAKAMQEYVTGLPELLARAQTERSSSSGGSGGSSGGGSNLTDYQAIFDYLLGDNKPKPVAVQKNLGGGMTYGNVGGYGAIYPTGSKGPAVKPTFQRTRNADRFE